MRRHIVSCAAMLLAGMGASLAIQQTPGGAPASGSVAAPADASIERLATTYRFENDGTGSVEIQGRFKALTVAGRDALGRFVMAYDPGHEEVRFDRLQTVKPSGPTIAADPVQVVERRVPLAGGLEAGYAMLPAPNFEVGDSLEVAVTRLLTTPIAKGEFWAEHLPASGDRTGPETVVLDLPAERPVAFWYDPATPPTVAVHGGRVVYRWELPPPSRGRLAAEPRATFAVSSFTSWEKLGDWFLHLEAGGAGSGEKARTQAESLVARSRSTREKAEAIYSWVSTSVRYLSLALAGNGFQPHAVDDVLAKAYGDCKDKNLLLATMLRDVGIQAQSALVSVAGKLRYPDVPIPSQFDHVVTVIALDSGETWIDSSLEVARFGQLLPSLRGGKALLVRPSGSVLVPIPEAPAPADTMEIRVSGSVTGAGTLTSSTEVELCGEVELPWRLLFHSGASDAIAAFGQGLAGVELAGAVADGTTSSDPAAVDEPFVIRLAAHKPGFINPLGTRNSPSIPSLIAWATARTEAASGSSSSLGAGQGADSGSEPDDRPINGLSRVRETIDLALPEGYSVEPPQDVHIQNGGLTYDATYESFAGRLHVERTVRRQDPGAAGAEAAWAALAQVVKGDAQQVAEFRRTAAGTGAEDALAGLSADELNQLGSKALNENQFETARATLAKAVAKDPESRYAWNNLGRAYLGLREWRKAEADFRKQIEVNPLDQYAFNNLGEALRNQQRFREAVEAYRSQLGVNPFDPFALPNLGRTLDDTYRFADAVPVLKQAHRVAPNDARVGVLLAHALREIGRDDEVRELLAEVNRTPGFPPLQEATLDMIPTDQPGLAVRIVNVGSADVDAVEQAANRRVADARARLNGETTPDTAFDDVARLAKVAEDLDTLGQIWLRRGNRDKARDYFTEALAISLSPAVAAQLADLEAAAGHMEKALRYEALARQGPAKVRAVPAAIEAWAEKKFKDRQERDAAMNAFAWELRDPRRISAQSPHRAAGAEPVGPGRVLVRALVAATGDVIAVAPLQGREPWRAQAVAIAKKLKLPPARVGGEPVRTSRTLDFRTTPSQTVEGVWGYGLNPSLEFWMPSLAQPMY
ncbi:MAG: tetratricopeptide repeat protein [Acidobacteria bacterium]|nr:MAG: tetratricopeptide repeat protein [Acidobacteriota bacterium]